MKLVWTPLSPLTIRACHFSIASVQSNMATVTHTLHGEAVCLVEFAPLQASQFFLCRQLFLCLLKAEKVVNCSQDLPNVAIKQALSKSLYLSTIIFTF